ncbi:hypothetical protein TNCV_1195061 [Trichonephila clavipes]|nr:hypothetical protein TNCV_1195061 [Trichonephila clavipes]
MAGEAVSLHSLLANRNCKIYRQNFEADDFPSGAVVLYKGRRANSRGFLLPLTSFRKTLQSGSALANVNYRVQHVEQLRKRFNTHVNRMIPFIKRFSYLHLTNLDDLQPDETEVKGIVPSPRYILRARAGNSAH